MNEPPDVFWQLALVFWTSQNPFPEHHGVAQFVQGDQAEPAVVLRQNERAAALGKRVAIASLDSLKGSSFG